jgi:trimeric autotransporter adhesin
LNAAMREYLESAAQQTQDYRADPDRALESGVGKYNRRIYRWYALIIAAVVVVGVLIVAIPAGAGRPSSPSLTGLTITSSAGEKLAQDHTSQLSATAGFSDGSTQDVTDSTDWRSGNKDKARIDDGGLLTAVGEGKVTITATHEGFADTMNLTMVPPETVTLSAISIEPDSAQIQSGQEHLFHAIGTLSNGEVKDVTRSAHWTSTHPNVATVNPGTGVVAAKSPGTATVSAEQDGVTGSAIVTVPTSDPDLDPDPDPDPDLTSIDVSPEDAAMELGTTQPFTAAGSYDNGETKDLDGVEWDTSNHSVATINPNGLLTAHEVSSEPISVSATKDGVTGMAKITVTAVLERIGISPNPIPYGEGQPQQLTVFAYYSDGREENVTAQATWTSSMPEVVTIAPGGWLSRQGTDPATITAVFGGISQTAAVEGQPGNQVE